jgi:hypothetical protein
VARQLTNVAADKHFWIERTMGEAEIAAFLTHLATERHVSASTQNQGAAPGFVRYVFVAGAQSESATLDRPYNTAWRRRPTHSNFIGLRSRVVRGSARVVRPQEML